MGQQLKGMGVKDLDAASFSNAVAAVFEGKQPEIAPEEAQKLIQDFLKELEEKMEKQARAEGEQFLAENGKKEGVKTTASGLQYVVEKEGSGVRPTAEDEVTVHYTGRLLNGQVFDSSVSRGEPATFPLNRVIPGWTEGVQLMKEGAKYTFFIPSDLAYGPQGIPNAFFRLFDIFKPLGIRSLERLPGGYGMMADDILSGIYAAIILVALQIIIHL